jgi:Uma2 family endonuclease
LPDDGDKYELVRGELFATPAPSTDHEMMLVRLTRILAPYVEKHGLGYVFHPRTVLRFEDSETEPRRRCGRVLDGRRRDTNHHGCSAWRAECCCSRCLRWHPATAPMRLEFQLVDVFGSE